MLNKIGFGLIFILGLIMVACSPTASARDSASTTGVTQDASPADIGAAALAGLEAIGWDIKGFEAEVRAVDGDYANVTITSTDPPGGFTAFMIRQDGEWTVAAHGSAYNPEELKAMGFPDSVLK
jgi:hypothetical protein